MVFQYSTFPISPFVCSPIRPSSSRSTTCWRSWSRRCATMSTILGTQIHSRSTPAVNWVRLRHHCSRSARLTHGWMQALILAEGDLTLHVLNCTLIVLIGSRPPFVFCCVRSALSTCSFDSQRHQRARESPCVSFARSISIRNRCCLLLALNRCPSRCSHRPLSTCLLRLSASVTPPSAFCVRRAATFCAICARTPSSRSRRQSYRQSWRRI